MNTECSGYENVFLPGNKSYIMMMMMQNAWLWATHCDHCAFVALTLFNQCTNGRIKRCKT
jgi:hypothetical protein